jgi:hypothetical protein
MPIFIVILTTIRSHPSLAQNDPREAIIRGTIHGRVAQARLAGRWLLERDSAEISVIRRSRAADLVVLGQRDSEWPQALDAPENVIMACGRPVLIPTSSHPKAGDRPLVAWNDSRESRRALHDALPLITGRKPATIIWVEPDAEQGKAAIADLSEYLGRRGLG